MTLPVAATATTIYFAPPDAGEVPRSRRAAAVVAVVAVHLLVLLTIAYAAIRPELPPPVRVLAVRLLEAPPSPPKVEPPKLPSLKVPPKVKQVVPPPVLAAAPRAPAAPVVFAVPPQPKAMMAPPVPSPPLAMPAPVVVAPRFDADYLQNPHPAYPAMSRRRGEEGRVVLRVRVSRDGLPLSIEVHQSSRFARLDEAAKNAVERWRFVPARQGDEPVESSVLVPMNFTLSH